MHHLQVDLVTHQFPDVADAILDHSGPEMWHGERRVGMEGERRKE